jgi:hypothetical protein
MTTRLLTQGPGRQYLASMESSNRFMRTLLSATVLLTGLLAFGPATAQDRTDYRRIPTEEGFLEVETPTGAVRECRRTGDGYRCATTTPDKLQSEVERLTRENDELRRRLGPARDGSRSQTHRGLPLDEDVDRALGVMERFLRRFINILREEKPDRT